MPWLSWGTLNLNTSYTVSNYLQARLNPPTAETGLLTAGTFPQSLSWKCCTKPSA